MHHWCSLTIPVLIDVLQRRRTHVRVPTAYGVAPHVASPPVPLAIASTATVWSPFKYIRRWCTRDTGRVIVHEAPHSDLLHTIVRTVRCRVRQMQAARSEQRLFGPAVGVVCRTAATAQIAHAMPCRGRLAVRPASARHLKRHKHMPAVRLASCLSDALLRALLD